MTDGSANIAKPRINIKGRPVKNAVIPETSKEVICPEDYPELEREHCRHCQRMIKNLPLILKIPRNQDPMDQKKAKSPRPLKKHR